MRTNSPVILPQSSSRFIRHSNATTWDRLSWDVRDEIIDLWHHPLIVQQSLEKGACQTTLQLLLDPHLLSPHLDEQANRRISDLCQWLRDNGVRFDLGFAPQILSADVSAREADTHQIHLDVH